MSQYSSRIHIKVTEPAIWEKFKDVDDAEFGLAGLAEDGSTSFVLDDWCCVEDEILGHKRTRPNPMCEQILEE